VFYGGARGGGKSDAVLGDWLSHAALYGRDAVGLMVRRERTQLMELVERSKQFYPLLGAKYHEQDKYWRFPDGARLRFAYLERDADAENYQGQSFTRVYVEEIGTFPSPGPVMKLMATLRSANGVPVGFRATGNPGGAGHQWVKARYIDPAPMGWEAITETFHDPFSNTDVDRQRVYIPSRLGDNAFLGADYVANLQMAGSDELVRAWLLGDWDVVEGAFFDCWNPSLHVVRPFEIPAHWLRFRAYDHGSAAPFSVGWWAISDGEELPDGRFYPAGAMIRYREWYGASAPNVGLKMTVEAIADGIIERERVAGEKPFAGDRDPHIHFSVADPSIFARDGGPSHAERFAKGNVRFRAADNARVPRRGAMGGWDMLRQRLVGQDDKPMLYVFETCRDLIRTLPALQHDAARPEDVDSAMEDHASDEARYACMARPWTVNAGLAVKPKFALDMPIKDLIARHVKAKARMRGHV
jgi:hypothetical protein